MPDAETEWQLDSMLIKALNVEAVNAFAQQAIYPNNQVIVITAPEKEGVENPTTEEILAIRDKVAAAEIEAYEDNTVKEPLIPEGTTLERFAREEDRTERRVRHDGMDAGQRSEGHREAHGLQSRRGSHVAPWPRAACRSSRTRSSTWAR